MNAHAHTLQCELGKCASHTTANSDACRGASAATMVAHTVLFIIGVVGMGRTEHFAQIVVVGGVMVAVMYHETYGAARRFALEHAAEKLHTVGFVASCRDATLPRPAAVEFRLYEIHVDVDARRHAVHHSADARSVAFAKRGEREKSAECVAHIAFRN